MGTADGEGPPPLAASAATAVPLLAQPIIAAPLGVAVGVCAVLVSRGASRFVTSDDPTIGFAKVVVAMIIRLLVVVGMLAAFYFLAPAGLAPFGIALIVGFLGALTYELFTAGRPARAAGDQGGR